MPDAPRAYAWPPRLLRAADAAYYLGMSETTFRQRVAAAVAPVLRGGVTAWDRQDLDAWVDRQRAPAAASTVNPWHV